MIQIIENHDEAFHIWNENNFMGRTVIHVDAHSDIQKDESLNIATYIHHAIKKGILNKYYWIAPKPSMEDKVLFKRSVNHLQDCGLKIKKICLINHTVEGFIEDCYVWMGPLSSLPPISEEALLDIDLDYFIFPRWYDEKTTFTEALVLWEKPKSFWDEIVKKINFNFVTICISIDGGFTPLQWRCLAPYISKLIESNEELFSLEAFEHGLELSLTDKEKSILYFEELIKKYSDTSFLAVAHFWMARLHVELYQIDLAKKHIEKASFYDSYFNNPWICTGLLYYYNGNSREALSHFRMWKDVVGDSDYFYYFWSKCIDTKSEQGMNEVIALCNKAIDINPNYPDPYIKLADIYMLRGEYDRSISNFERSLFKSLMNAPGYSDLFPIQDVKSRKSGVSGVRLSEVLYKLIMCYVKVKNHGKSIHWYIFREKLKLKKNLKHELKIFLHAPYLYDYNPIKIIKITFFELKNMVLQWLRKMYHHYEFYKHSFLG